jgi:hypothetical protein
MDFGMLMVTGLHSICCGEPVKLLPPKQREGDTLYRCQKCGKPAEGYFSTIYKREPEVIR